MFAFSYDGIGIDFSAHSYRKYFGIFGLRFGRWKDLPEMKYVTVYKERSSQTMSVESISSNISSAVYKINLIISKEVRITADIKNNKEKALENGKYIASKLKLRLLDYTGMEPQWIELS